MSVLEITKTEMFSHIDAEANRVNQPCYEIRFDKIRILSDKNGVKNLSNALKKAVKHKEESE